jgi:pilus assembly protein CpaE
MLNRLFARGKEEMRALDAPIQPALAAAAEIPSRNEEIDRDLRPISPAVAVIGAKGGAGATTVAVNLAAALSLLRTTTIIDGHLQHPGVANLVGAEPAHSIIELLTRVGDVDRKLFDACAGDVAGSHFKLLSPPLSGEAALQTDLTELSRCLDLIRHYSDFWVLDLPQHLDRHLVTIADQCSKIVLVFEATVPGVAACQRWLKVFRDLGYEKDRIICLLNRSGSKFKGVEEQLDDSFFGQPIFRLPNASSAIWDCANKAVPLVVDNPSHPYSKAVLKLAEQISQTIEVRSK